MTKNKDEQTMVSVLISEAIDRLAPKKNQRELAREMGFVRSNMLSMLRTGAARVPFGRIPIIASVLGIDPALLLRLHLREQWPEFEEVVFDIFGGVLTDADKAWIAFFEEVGMLAPPADPEQRQKLKDILSREDWEEN